MRPTRPILLLATLLFGVLGCSKEQNLEGFGDFTVITNTTGGTPDPDGYTLKVQGQDSVAMADNDTTTFPHLAIGDYAVSLTGVLPGCSVAGGASRSIYVNFGVKKFEFDVTCP